MLSPNAKLSPQTGNWAPNLEFGDTKMKLGTRILGWKQQRPIARTKSEMRNKKLRVPIKSWDWEQFPSIARPISQLRIRKAKCGGTTWPQPQKPGRGTKKVEVRVKMLPRDQGRGTADKPARLRRKS